MQVVNHHTAEALNRLMRSVDRPLMVLKLRAMVLAKQGWIAARIAQAVGKSVRTIQQWVGDYNRDGLEGLKDKRGGNHRYLSPQQEAQLSAHLDAKAQDPADGVRHAAQLIPFIEEHFGVTYALSGLYDLLNRLGYEWLSPRPRHPKNDPGVVEAFKKTPRRKCSGSPPSIPTSRSRSGSRTRPASVRRAP